jgi:hypothetical protein
MIAQGRNNAEISAELFSASRRHRTTSRTSLGSYR